MINLYQNQMSDSLYHYVNQHGHAAAEIEFPEYAVRVKTMLKFQKINLSDLAYYECVAKIDTNDLEEAFKIGNNGPFEKIEQMRGRRRHTMSVGDVCELDGKFYQVMSVGFEEIV